LLIWLRLSAVRAWIWTRPTAGIRIDIRMTMIPITTSSSTIVKARRRCKRGGGVVRVGVRMGLSLPRRVGGRGISAGAA